MLSLLVLLLLVLLLPALKIIQLPRFLRYGGIFGLLALLGDRSEYVHSIAASEGILAVGIVVIALSLMHSLNFVVSFSELEVDEEW
jgi:hypothetical protein